MQGCHGKSPGPDGLPSELYVQLWDKLGEPLTHAFNAYHATGPHPTISARQRTSDYTLVPKRANARDLANRRPIAGINADVKIASRAISTRLAAALQPVIDPTQTGFLPGRWIGDNILSHTELADLLTAHNTDGAMLFLDFAKAFDWMDRAWTFRVMEAMRFGEGARRWAELFLTDNLGRVRVNGAPTDPFPILSGALQGSPPSSLLYLIQAQPLLALIRRMAATGAVQPVTLPFGGAAPLCHMHADDTTIHAASPADCDKIIAGPVAVFTAASGAQLNPTKTKTLLFGSHARQAAYTSAVTGITYTPATKFTHHLGVTVGSGTDAEVERQKKVNTRTGLIGKAVLQWSKHNVSFIGRAYVGKQNLQSQLVHLLSFDSLTPAQLTTLNTLIYGYVSRNRYTEEPSAASCNPGRLVCGLPRRAGGAGAPALELFAIALAAKRAFRHLQPPPTVWKSIYDFQLMRSTAFSASHPDVPPTLLHRWGLGPAIVASTLDVNTAELPPRLRDGIKAAQRIGITRAISSQSPEAARLVMRDRLFLSPRAVADPATHHACHTGAATNGLWCLDDLRAAITGDPQFATVSRVDLAAIRASLDDTMTRTLDEALGPAAASALPPAAPPPPRRTSCSVPLPGSQATAQRTRLDFSFSLSKSPSAELHTVVHPSETSSQREPRAEPPP